MTTTRSTHTTRPDCTSCAGFEIKRPATKTAQYWGDGGNREATGHETLCDSCATNTRAYCNIQDLIIEEPSADDRPYAAWFCALLDRDETCTNYTIFEREAHKGFLSYNISMTDGYYAPEPFENWVIGFRKDPTGQLYWGNDLRHILAPKVNSYTAIIQQIFG